MDVDFSLREDLARRLEEKWGQSDRELPYPQQSIPLMRRAVHGDDARLLGRRVRITDPKNGNETAVTGEIVTCGNPIVVVELDRPLNPSEDVLIGRVVRRRSDVEVIWE